MLLFTFICVRLVTEREKQLLASKQYTELVHEQKRVDKEIDEKLARQEEELRLEEEKFYEAKKEASRIAKLRKKKEETAKNSTKKGEKSWLGDQENDWEVAGGEDDFEMFLANVKARSLKTAARLRQGSGDGQSSSSSAATSHSKDRSERSQADGSSLDLEWEHEDGVIPQKKPRSSTEENLVLASSRVGKDSPAHSNDLEWDNDFVSAEEISSDTAQLLAAEQTIQQYLPR
ncbi:hypothetical protein FSP39_017181 [Pinctada imbricata]|uniref:Uncharacterized protein n=1 Tax=Pinctada imbricata TaxID=66713 RepID=A0AA88XSW6_PINIB|nr:hypothetical protein FSP39_017181 [Pinctada imbricata]